MKFAFLVHPLTNDTRQLVSLNKAGRFTDSWGKDLFTFFESLHVALENVDEYRKTVPKDKPWVVDYLPQITSLKGPSAEGRIYEIPMLPHEILEDSNRALGMMEAAVTDAHQWGAEIIGLGSMTGIVGGRGAYLAEKSPIAVTTGNSLTVFAALECLQFACQETGIDISEETIAVVGVPGSIATAAAKILKPSCKEVLLVGRSNSARSRKVSAEVGAEFTCDIESALQRSRIVFTATSSGDCIDQRWLRPSSIVVDVAVPTDVIGSKSIRDDTLILSGGLSKIPEGNKINSSYFFFQRGMIPSCLGETIVLALENRAESYSLGQDLSPEGIMSIGKKAKENGFNFTRLCSFGAAIDEREIIRFRKQFRSTVRVFPVLNSGCESVANSKKSHENVSVCSGSSVSCNGDAGLQEPLQNGASKTVLSNVVSAGSSTATKVCRESSSGIGSDSDGSVENRSVKSRSMAGTSELSNGTPGTNGKPIESSSEKTPVHAGSEHQNNGREVQADAFSDSDESAQDGLVQRLAKRSRALFRRHINSVIGGLGEAAVKNFVRGENCYLWDDRGERYLDFVGGFGSLNLGHNHPAVHQAIQTVMSEQAPGFAQSAINPLAATLAEKLASLAPGELDTVFFTNSGTESVEAALKTARVASQRSGFVYCRRSYHGKSFGSLSVTGNDAYQKPFGPLLPNCEPVDFGDLDALANLLKTRKFGAFIVEPMQAEGGMIQPPEGYLSAAQELCRATGTFLIVDEVQTGLGRTGKMFASEWYGLEPDFLTVAKSLGGGIAPIGAMVVNGDIWRQAYGTLESFALHTSTFGGGSLATACGLAALETLQYEGLMENAVAMGNRLKQGLNQLADEIQIIKEVRGEGLLLGLEINPMNESIVSHWKDIDESMLTSALGPRMDEVLRNISSMYVMNALLNHHNVYTQTARSNPLVLRIQPPLTINENQVDEFLAAVKATAGEISYTTELVDGLFARTGVGDSSQ